MPTRYVDEDYGRTEARGIRRDREGNQIRDSRDSRGERTTRPIEVERPRADVRTTRPMEVERPRADTRPLEPMDTMRGDRRANTAAPRVEPRMATAPLSNPRDRDDDMMDYQRPAAGYARPPQTRGTPYEDDFSDLAPSARPIIDPGRNRDEPRPQYNEYFLPGEGIDREVIQSEICRYLGQDATCKPGSHGDGRRGYIIRAYRALTTEMIRSLKEDSAKWQSEQSRSSRRNQRPITYAQMRDQTRYNDDVAMDDVVDDQYARGYAPPRAHDVRPHDDPRIPRGAATTTYLPDPGFPAYAPIGQMQTTIPGAPDYYPRTIPPLPGNITPPGRTPNYGNAFPQTTRPSAPPMPASTYTDPRGDVVRSGYGYQETRRHR